MFASSGTDPVAAGHVWRGVWILIGVLALVVWVFRFTLPESPRYLATHGRGKEALDILGRMGIPQPTQPLSSTAGATPRAIRSASCSACSPSASSPA
jgi:MFS family permease